MATEPSNPTADATWRDRVMPEVCIVIPAYNSKRELASLLERLASQAYPADRYSVVVVDDGSQDGTDAYIEDNHPQVRLERQARGGSYRARNLGARVGRGSILAFTDADCLPDKYWLINGVRAMLESDHALVVGAVDMIIDDARSAIQKYDAAFGLRQEYYATHLEFGATANLFVRRAAFEHVGGFRSDLLSGGDQEFCHRVIKHNFTLTYEPAAKIGHPARRTLRELVKKTIRVSKGRAISFPSKRYLCPRLLSLLPLAYYNDRSIRSRKGVYRRFVMIHYFLEVTRIVTYAKTRLLLALSSSSLSGASDRNGTT